MAKRKNTRSATIENNSKKFSICKGVFQGGGCRGIAYVGVYEEAIKNGISFSEVYGTSAGAIVSSMIAAGATPEDMNNWLASLDIHKIQNRSIKFKILYFILNTIPKSFYKILGLRFSGFKRFLVEFLHILAHGSVYNSKLLQLEIEKELKRLTGVKDRDVLFSDLKIPLRIVCSDLLKSEAKIFGLSKKEETPVSKAVVCSASVPLYFSAVDQQYCDGCIVSNLPVFAVSNNGYFDKVLAFTLSSKEGEKLDTKNFVSTLTNAFSTITSAGVKIQMDRVPNCYRINIDCTGYELLDFPNLKNDKWRNELIEIGRNSMRIFLQQNHPIIKKNDFYESHTQFTTYTQISYLCEDRFSEVFVSMKNTEWVWDLFPILWKWRYEKTKVNVVCSQSLSNNTDEKARRRLLAHMGCDVRIIDVLPLSGFFFSLHKDLWKGLVISHGKDEKQISRFYNKEENDFLLGCSIEKILSMSSLEYPSLMSSTLRPRLQIIEENILFTKLIQISFYHNAFFSVVDINPSSLYTMSKYIYHHKYLNSEYLNRIYNYENIELYAPAEITIANDKTSIVVPPICEERDGKVIIVDGKARCYYALRHNITNIKVVMVRNVQERLASNNTYKLSEVVVSDINQSVNASSFEFDYSFYRPIEPTFHPSSSYLL